MPQTMYIWKYVDVYDYDYTNDRIIHFIVYYY